MAQDTGAQWVACQVLYAWLPECLGECAGSIQDTPNLADASSALALRQHAAGARAASHSQLTRPQLPGIATTQKLLHACAMHAIMPHALRQVALYLVDCLSMLDHGQATLCQLGKHLSINCMLPGLLSCRDNTTQGGKTKSDDLRCMLEAEALLAGDAYAVVEGS